MNIVCMYICKYYARVNEYYCVYVQYVCMTNHYHYCYPTKVNSF